MAKTAIIQDIATVVCVNGNVGLQIATIGELGQVLTDSDTARPDTRPGALELRRINEDNSAWLVVIAVEAWNQWVPKVLKAIESLDLALWDAPDAEFRITFAEDYLVSEAPWAN